MSRERLLAAFRSRLAAGDVLVGMQHNSGSTAVLEIIAYSKFDFVIVDMEHSTYTMRQVEDLVRAAEAAEIVAFVRVLNNDHHVITHALETGAQGILVPHISSRADCEKAMSAMRYPPAGVRGRMRGTRAARWGMDDWATYQAWADEEVIFIPILEDREAIEAIDDILDVDGLEVISIGPSDLSQSYGHPGAGLRSPAVMAGLERAIERCEPKGIGIMTVPIPDLSPAFARTIVEKGAKLIWYGVDVTHIANHFRTLREEVVGSTGNQVAARHGG